MLKTYSLFVEIEYLSNFFLLHIQTINDALLLEYQFAAILAAKQAHVVVVLREVEALV